MTPRAAVPDAALFDRYRSDGDREARRALIERHLPLARRLARRYARSAEPADDLVQVAAVGLIKAVDRYDPARGTAFPGFAIPTILGELKRHFRDTRWAVHVPRDLQERAQVVQREVERLTQSMRQAPSLAQVAESLGIAVEDVIEARAAFTGIDATSLDVPVATDEDAGDTAGDRLGAEEVGYELVEERDAIAPALAGLPERDRIALRLSFVEEMTQSEIGARLNVSQMQVSRMIRRSLKDLRSAVVAAS
jgi:RNA polymerase sigma-B factor